MATRSRIGLQLSDGSILSVYHHYDGYPEWLGRILTTHYNTKDKVTELIDGGDMSSCWTDTVWGEDRTDGQKYGPETYAARGENCPPRLDSHWGDFINNGEEYGYIFKNGEWVCYDTKTWSDTFTSRIEIPQGALAV
jgi:hypothetical protein